MDYQFTDLLPGAYCIEFESIPLSDGYPSSPADQGDGTNDSKGDSTGIDGICLTSDYLHADQGFYVTGSIAGSVACLITPEPGVNVRAYEDFDGDGQPDSLFPSADTTTQADGSFRLEPLQVGLAGDPDNTTKFIVQVDPTFAAFCELPSDVVPSITVELDTDTPTFDSAHFDLSVFLTS